MKVCELRFAKTLERELTAVTEQRDGLHELHNKNAARSKELLDLCGTLRKELTAMTAQRDGLRAGIDYASDQLIKVKEQRDQWANLWADLSRASVKDTVKVEREVVRVTEQRDRLADALKEIYNVSAFDYDSMPEIARRKYREVVSEMADVALQSLNQTEQ